MFLEGRGEVRKGVQNKRFLLNLRESFSQVSTEFT